MQVHTFLINPYRQSVDNTIFLSKEEEVDDSVFCNDASYYFDKQDYMLRDDIIGSANIGKKWINSKLYYYPNTVFIMPLLQNLGYGKLLYLSILSSIKTLTDSIETEPIFAQHNAIEPWHTQITPEADYVYNSLEKYNFIKQIGDKTPIDWFDNPEPTRLFKILKYPKHINFVFSKDMGSDKLILKKIYKAKF